MTRQEMELRLYAKKKACLHVSNLIATELATREAPYSGDEKEDATIRDALYQLQVEMYTRAGQAREEQVGLHDNRG